MEEKVPPEGEKTKFATMEEENRALNLENAELKIERNMLKKAAAYRKEPKVKAREKYEFIEAHPEYGSEVGQIPRRIPQWVLQLEGQKRAATKRSG